MKPLMAMIVVLALGGGLFFASAVIVKETEQVVILQFGEVVRLVDAPGLSFRVPFIQDAKRFDKRWLEWDGEPNQITTLDKRYIYIDVFARWRIKDPLVFIAELRDEESAQGRLDDILDNATRNVVANHRLIELIRATNRQFEFDIDEIKVAAGTATSPKDAGGKTPAERDDTQANNNLPNPDGAVGDVPAGSAADDKAASSLSAGPADNSDEESQRLLADVENYEVKFGRNKLTRMVLEKASAKAAEMGIEIKDIQIKRINYIESVELKVFDRMISERKRVAEAYRSEGQGRSAEILGKMEMELQQIQSEAYRESQKIMGRADAKAADIYAKAYNKNPEFYQFTKTMESYRQTIDDSYSLVLSTDGDYAGHLQSMKGGTKEK